MKRFAHRDVGCTPCADRRRRPTVMTPPSHAQPLGDALVVHAGGRGERLNSALALMDNGAAPVMVIMNGNDPLWPDAFALCNRSNPYIVLCPTPQPDNTVGEASTLGDLIDEQNWRTVVVVTSDYHLRRTMILDGRCAGDTDLRGVAAPADIHHGSTCCIDRPRGDRAAPGLPQRMQMSAGAQV